MEDALAHSFPLVGLKADVQVLILVVMEDALAQSMLSVSNNESGVSLNPCCNGRCTRTQLIEEEKKLTVEES